MDHFPQFRRRGRPTAPSWARARQLARLQRLLRQEPQLPPVRTAGDRVGGTGKRGREMRTGQRARRFSISFIFIVISVGIQGHLPDPHLLDRLSSCGERRLLLSLSLSLSLWPQRPPFLPRYGVLQITVSDLSRAVENEKWRRKRGWWEGETIKVRDGAPSK